MFKKIFLLILVGVLFAYGNVAEAGPFDKARSNLKTALESGEGTGLQSELGVSIGVVINGILSLVGTIFLGLTIYAGILWMTAQGSSDKIEKAKGILQTAVIGMFVVLAAYAITNFVTSRINKEVPSTPIPEAQPIP